MPSSTSPARTSPTGAGRRRGRTRCATAAFSRRARWRARWRTAHTPPKVFVSASGVGYYGPHGDEPVTEDTPPGSDFLARLCVEWEQEARAVESPATRLAIVRTGLVLVADGGALKRMLLPFKLGLGATLGSGDQFMPWIHVDDWTAMVSWLIAERSRDRRVQRRPRPRRSPIATFTQHARRAC